MTLGSIDWPADRVARLHQRAESARSGAEARCRRSAALRQSATDISAVRLQASYPAESSPVPLARTAVAAIAARAGADGDRLDAIKLAVSEAITNAVVHAYPDDTGRVYVRAVIVDGQLTVSIIDDGSGPRTPSRAPGLGYGLALMATSAEQFTIRPRRSRGTEVKMGWAVHPPRRRPLSGG